MKKLVAFLVLFFSFQVFAGDVTVVDEKTGEVYHTGLVIPKGAFRNAKHATFTDEELADLPESYDSKETAVKNQGQCGSCSHFASTAVYEHILLAKSAVENDLSEQSLLNCGKYGNYKCSGSFEHFKYLTESGAPLEKDFPYVAHAQSCKSFTTAVEKPVEWGMVGKGRATVDEVRAGLVKYGSLWITVSASGAWGRPGPVRRCSGGGGTNHAVTVVGYKADPDNKGKYLFHIKNSWGATWNGDGHVWMNLGCDSLGADVSYLKLAE